jgi:hypothetical protein
MKLKTPRSFWLWLLIALLVFIGVGAIISGAMLFIAPDGHLFQWTTEQLTGTPFSNYLIPGLILFTLLGLFPLFVSYGLLRKPNWHWPETINPLKKQHWAWTASWAAGIIMLIWIGTETVLLGLISFLQTVIAVYGLLIIVLTFIPAVKRHFTKL